MTSPYAENALARFLLVILLQLNLRDVNWEKVASSQYLLHPIPSGHAARMKFHRFRKSTTDHQPRKRRSLAVKPRACKESSSSAKNICVKKEAANTSESAVNLALYPEFTPDVSPHLGSDDDDFDSPRFMTPCSDDMAPLKLVHRPARDRWAEKDGGLGAETAEDWPAIKQEDTLWEGTEFDKAYAICSLGSSQAAEPDAAGTLWVNKVEDEDF